MAKTIGIDLGTTNSCVGVLEGGKPVIIPNSEGFRTTPSVVAVSKTGERLVGDAAKRQAVTNAQNTVGSIKRLMGSDARMTLGGKKYSPQEISAMILQRLKRDAESYLGETVTDAVITVPAYFSDAQRQATKDAGLIAGLNVQRIINEPTAAALAYGLDHETAQKIMVYDLGGGTFDVSVIEIGDGVIEVLATSGDNHLGGDDFDERVTDYLIKEFKKQEKIDLAKDPVAMQRVREAAEKAKIELSAAVTTSVSLPFVSVNKDGPVHMELSISRAKFDELTSDLVERTAIPVQNALQDAGVSASSLSKVLLVGGSTRIPAVQEKVRKLTGHEPSKGLNPDECVSLGAAIQAGTLSGQLAVGAGNAGGGILLLDVTPLSLSIETVGGVATSLIDRNTTIPTKYSRVFSTAANFQTSVEINVLQGERKFARDNKCLGKFKLDGIKRAVRGVPQIEVTFEIDANGIVKVSAKDLGTGRQQNITITASSNLSDSDIQRAVRDAADYETEDRQRKEKIDIRNDAEVLAGQVNACLERTGKDFPKEEKHRVKEDLAVLRKKLSKTKPDDISDVAAGEIRQAADALKISAANLLSAAQPEQPTSEPQQPL